MVTYNLASSNFLETVTKSDFQSSLSVLVKEYYHNLNVLAKKISSLQLMTEYYFPRYWWSKRDFALSCVFQFRECIAQYLS